MVNPARDGAIEQPPLREIVFNQHLQHASKLVHGKKFTSPIESLNTTSLMTGGASRPEQIKVIDLRNPQIRRLVMDSLNDIIAERNKSRMHKHQHNLNYQNILQSTPKVIRIQNSLDEEAVLIEKLNLIGQDQRSTQRSNSRPPSRSGGEQQADQVPVSPDTLRFEEEKSSDGILRMSPRSQTRFFDSLHKIYHE